MMDIRYLAMDAQLDVLFRTELTAQVNRVFATPYQH